jgi:hypothetical protein
MDTQLFILPQRGRHCWTCATSQAADRLFTTNEVLYVKSHLPSPVQDIEKKYKYSFNTLTNARKARIFTRSGCFGLNELQLAGVKRLFPAPVLPSPNNELDALTHALHPPHLNSLEHSDGVQHTFLYYCYCRALGTKNQSAHHCPHKSRGHGVFVNATT